MIYRSFDFHKNTHIHLYIYRFLVEMYLILVTIHIYANYSAVKVLTFNSLNEDRLILLFHNYIDDGIIHDTKLINQQESLLPFHNSRKTIIYVTFCYVD